MTIGDRPRWLHAVLGVVCVLAGAVLVLRPFTSLTLLIVIAGVAAIVTGALRWATTWLDRLVAAGWVLLGVAVLAWPDLSVVALGRIVGIAMVVGGVTDAAGALRGTWDARLATVLEALASVVLGAVALAWPDITPLVVAVVFGARTMLFGLAELRTVVRGPAHDVERHGAARRAISLTGAVLALALAGGLGTLSVLINRATPVVDAFYDAPAEVPDEPGVLLRAEPFTRQIPDGAVAWRMLYTTTLADGQAALASALVVAPAESTATPHPVIAWAHGTTGVARHCAPSVLAEPLESGAFFALDRVLDAGWVLVATDYPGLGTEGTHPYLVGDANGRSVLDAVRAAHQLGDVGTESETIVWGHSQGGGVALWTGQLAPTYAPDVGLLGVAAAAPAADLPAFVDTIESMLGGSIFASYVLTGYAGTYPDVRFEDYVRPGAAAIVNGLAERCLGEPAVLGSVLATITVNMSVFTGLGGGALEALLADNVPAGPFEMPVLLAQGTTDTIIDPAAQAEFAARLCADGAPLDYRTYDGLGHVALVDTDSPYLDDLMAWTTARLSGLIPHVPGSSAD